jgi:hypothetical protein
MGKMVICKQYIIWKKNPAAHSIETHTIHIFHFLYYNKTIYISNNTLILPIRHMNTTILQLKKQVVHIDPFFITYESFFNQ